MATTKTLNKTSEYFAVRRGKGICSCIFLLWEDCKKHVEEFDDAEYKVFDEVEEAAAYVQEHVQKNLDTEKALLDERECSLASAPAENNNEEKNEKGKNQVSTTKALSPTKGAPSNEVTRAETIAMPSTASAKLLVSITAVPDESQQSKKKKKCLSSAPSNDVRSRLRKPTKKWETFFEEFNKSYNRKTGKFEIDHKNEKLKRWLEDQDYHYRCFREGRQSAMYDEKVDRLRDLGYVFRFDVKKDKLENKSKGRTTIYKQWEISCEKLKQYMADHNGSCNVDKKDGSKKKLRQWTLDQQAEYKRMQEGKKSFMNKEKIKRLTEIGFEFEHVAWKDRIEELKAYKAEHGNTNVPEKHATLGKWMHSIRRHTCLVNSPRKTSRDINATRLEELKELGFKPGRPRYHAKCEEDNVEFDDMIEKLKQFKAENGTCLVVRIEPNIELHNWVFKQRLEYKKLQLGKMSRLTANRLQRLTDIGFVFRQKSNYQQWENRVEELRQYKAEHGHTNIATSHPALGEFVGRQRVQYRQRQDGLKSPMTTERIQILSELDFDFQVGNRKPKGQLKKPKTWDERFSELLDYKEEYDHTVVTQHTPGLGSWVHNQRKDFKLMKDGKRSSMTAEKALKLTAVGFVFDVFASKQQKRNVNDMALDDEVS